MNYVGITERGDAALDLRWFPWVKKGNPAILITKDPEKLYDILASTPEHKDFNIIIHTTITGYGRTIIEPNVPPYTEALRGYRKLIELYSAKRIVLRVDPIIPIEKGILLAKKVIKERADTRIRISFIDLYPHVMNRLRLNGLKVPFFSTHAPIDLRRKLWKELGKPEVCGEPGLTCTGCVSALDCETFGIIPFDERGKQRQYCACLVNKKELLTARHPCEHKCIYCYWKN